MSYHIEYLDADSHEDTVLVALVAGNISLVDRQSVGRASRCEPLACWARWLSSLGSSIRLSVRILKPTVAKTIAWIERSVSASLAIICKYVGGDKIQYLNGLIQLGEQKFTSRHTAILAAADREYFREYPIGSDTFVYDSTFR